MPATEEVVHAFGVLPSPELYGVLSRKASKEGKSLSNLAVELIHTGLEGERYETKKRKRR